MSQARILKLEKGSATAVESLQNWMEGTKPTTEAESHFADNPEDLVALLENKKPKITLSSLLKSVLLIGSLQM